MTIKTNFLLKLNRIDWFRIKTIMIASILIPLFFIISIYLFLGYFNANATIFFDFPAELEVSLIESIISGLLVSLLEIYIFKKHFRKSKSIIRIGLKTIIYGIFIFFAILVSSYFYISTESTEFINSYSKDYLGIITSRGIFYSLGVHLSAVTVALFLIEIDSFLGQGATMNLLLGKYTYGKEENRVFMFMDLKSSTTHAEKLGHLTYSKLIQDCFIDVTKALLKYNGTVYQYVGDEIIISWKNIDESNIEDIVNTFEVFRDTIKKKSNYYIEKYDIVPEFKAAVHKGKVVMTEVGELKREIAFHGDVLNTAARLEGFCNEKGYSLIVSNTIYSLFVNPATYKLIELGALNLKGKQEKVIAYGMLPYVL